MSDGQAMAYIGREACGCVTCVTLDNPDHKREVAKDLAQWVRWGLTVERVAVADARSAFTHCPHRDAVSEAQAIVTPLPALDYTCIRCGVQIHHDSDAGLVRAVAVHHNAAVHRSEEFTFGTLIIRWTGFAPPDLVDTLVAKLSERFGSRGVDLWVDNMQAIFAYLQPEWLEECMELIAKYVGPDLEVIDRR